MGATLALGGEGSLRGHLWLKAGRELLLTGPPTGRTCAPAEGKGGSLPSRGCTDAPTEMGQRGPGAQGWGRPLGPQWTLKRHMSRTGRATDHRSPPINSETSTRLPLWAPVWRARATPWGGLSQGLLG